MVYDIVSSAPCQVKQAREATSDPDEASGPEKSGELRPPLRCRFASGRMVVVLLVHGRLLAERRVEPAEKSRSTKSGAGRALASFLVVAVLKRLRVTPSMPSSLIRKLSQA